MTTLATGVTDELRFLTVWDDINDLARHADDVIAEDLYAMTLRR